MRMLSSVDFIAKLNLTPVQVSHGAKWTAGASPTPFWLTLSVIKNCHVGAKLSPQCALSGTVAVSGWLGRSAGPGQAGPILDADATDGLGPREAEGRE